MRKSAQVFLSLMGLAAIFVGGCAARRSQAIPWSTAVLVKPVPPDRPFSPVSAEDPVPGLRLEIPPPPAPLASISAPARPRTIAPSPNENAKTGKLEAPQIVPDLSPEESASLQKETEESLQAAERNLAGASGRNLNAVQADLASKVRSFISDAREAGRAGDWSQARNLARKAQVLSAQLSGSL